MKKTKKELVDVIDEKNEVIEELQMSFINTVEATTGSKRCGVWSFFKWLIIISVSIVAIMFIIGFIGGMKAGLGKTLGVCAPDMESPAVECAYITLDDTPIEVTDTTYE